MESKVKVVILAGGYGTRISEESHLKPKPMIEIGNEPILWHIMKSYSYHGFNDFIICCGYKGYVIKEYFFNYYLHRSDVTFDFSNNNKMTIHNNVSEPWKITLLDTGLDTMTGGRIKQVKPYIDDTFMLTYGDGVSDININELVKYHKEHKKIATITAIQLESRFGVIDMNNENMIMSFKEKNKADSGWINGGFMVLEPSIFDLIEDEKTIFERTPLESCAKNNQLIAYKHHGFWQCMDTLRDKVTLEKLLENGTAPWKKW